jgi:SAM-dependent MidA family methyltransferase
MEEVLYHPKFGYYTSFHTKAPMGTGGDFYTSPDLDPILGQLLAHQFQRMAEGLESFSLVELGAGTGALARQILTCSPFPYFILERSPAMQARQQEALRDFDVRWIDELPQNLTGCIFSNEFFDALPVHRFVRRGGRLREIFVSENFREIEAEPQLSVELPLKEGQFADVSFEAREWIRRIAESLCCGFHLAIDYGYLREEFFAHPYGTLMCYRRHQVYEDPYSHIGEQDMTAHVNFSDLIDEGRSCGLTIVRFSDQKSFLIDLGILDEMQHLAAAADAVSLQRLLRIKNLILPTSMGERFKVLVQEKSCRGGP